MARTALAHAFADCGDAPARAIAEATRAATIAGERSAPSRMVEARLALARITGAEEEAQQALALAHNLHDDDLLLRCHHALARIKHDGKEPDAARDHLRRAIAIVNSIADSIGANREAFLRTPVIETILRDARRT